MSSVRKDQGDETSRDRCEFRVSWCFTSRLLKLRLTVAEMSFPPVVRTVPRPSMGVDTVGVDGERNLAGESITLRVTRWNAMLTIISHFATRKSRSSPFSSDSETKRVYQWDTQHAHGTSPGDTRSHDCKRITLTSSSAKSSTRFQEYRFIQETQGEQAETGIPVEPTDGTTL